MPSPQPVATKVFKALSDPTRQRILQLLEKGRLSVGEIVDHFPLSQPTISRHLAVLREASLVLDERHGQRVLYRLRDGGLASSMEFFGQFRQCRRILAMSGDTPSDRDDLAAPPQHGREAL